MVDVAKLFVSGTPKSTVKTSIGDIGVYGLNVGAHLTLDEIVDPDRIDEVDKRLFEQTIIEKLCSRKRLSEDDDFVSLESSDFDALVDDDIEKLIKSIVEVSFPGELSKANNAYQAAINGYLDLRRKYEIMVDRMEIAHKALQTPNMIKIGEHMGAIQAAHSVIQKHKKQTESAPSYGGMIPESIRNLPPQKTLQDVCDRLDEASKSQALNIEYSDQLHESIKEMVVVQLDHLKVSANALDESKAASKDSSRISKWVLWLTSAALISNVAMFSYSNYFDSNIEIISELQDLNGSFVNDREADLNAETVANLIEVLERLVEIQEAATAETPNESAEVDLSGD